MGTTTPMRFRQAIVSALADEMRADSTVMLFGEDVAEAEGPFKTSEGLLTATLRFLKWDLLVQQLAQPLWE